MNREIKFRVWDTQIKQMILPEDEECNYSISAPSDNGGLGYFLLTQKGILQCNDGIVLDNWHESYRIQQFTGLKDKNGKDIYEGDMLKVSGSAYPNIFKVEYSTGEYGTVFGFALNRIDNECQWNLANTPKRYQIIGNIFENPELLKS